MLASTLFDGLYSFIERLRDGGRDALCNKGFKDVIGQTPRPFIPGHLLIIEDVLHHVIDTDIDGKGNLFFVDDGLHRTEGDWVHGYFQTKGSWRRRSAAISDC